MRISASTSGSAPLPGAGMLRKTATTSAARDESFLSQQIRQVGQTTWAAIPVNSQSRPSHAARVVSTRMDNSIICEALCQQSSNQDRLRQSGPEPCLQRVL